MTDIEKSPDFQAILDIFVTTGELAIRNGYRKYGLSHTAIFSSLTKDCLAEKALMSSMKTENMVPFVKSVKGDLDKIESHLIDFIIREKPLATCYVTSTVIMKLSVPVKPTEEELEKLMADDSNFTEVPAIVMIFETESRMRIVGFCEVEENGIKKLVPDTYLGAEDWKEKSDEQVVYRGMFSNLFNKAKKRQRAIDPNIN